MTVQCKVNTAEMREAFRLNLTPAFWWKAALGNVRALIYIAIMLALIASSLKSGQAIEWRKIGSLLALVALFFGLYVFRLHRTVVKTVTKLQESCSSMTIDSQTVTSTASNGTLTSVPWSAITRWREGKLVFTIGDAKTFRTIPKSAFSEIQSGELRSLLLSQVPGDLSAHQLANR
ncbi:MAG TPA: YcxB family protein [Acidobacteriaceae bacterium]|nr:YcxB family protein [Acidobacteriaceae bacterium]